MKLAIKLCSILVPGIVVILAVDAYLAVRRESEDFLSDMEHDATLLGHAMKDLVADVWKTSGEQRALRLVEEANREEDVVQMRWVWLEQAADAPHKPQVDLEKLGPVVRGAEASFRVSGRSKAGQLVAYVPVPVPGRHRGALELSESMARLRSHNRTTISRALAVAGGLLTVGGASVAVLGAILVARPLGQLAAMVRRIGEGDLEARVDLRTGDELSELAHALNMMCQHLSQSRDTARKETEARIAAIEQLRHADRLATVGRLASGIAHEVGTPLNVISARAKQIRTGELQEVEVKKNADVIGTQSDRIARTIRQLLALARPSRGGMEPVDLGKTARASMTLLKPLAERHGVSLRAVVCHEPPIVLASEGQMEQVLTNLIVNAIQAMPQGGEAVVEVSRHRACRPGDAEAKARTCACVSVSDEGVGIAEEDLSKVFDPFFTTKDVGEGTGLGLSLAYEIVHERGGWIEVSSTAGRGSCFSIYLPLANTDCVGHEPDGAPSSCMERTD